jgi:hypothetical protein
MKLRCRLGYHRWSRWGSVLVQYLEVYRHSQCNAVHVARRWCQDCNRMQERRMGKTFAAFHPSSPYYKPEPGARPNAQA